MGEYNCKCRSVRNCDVKLKVEIYEKNVILQILQYDTTRRFTLDLQNLNRLIGELEILEKEVKNNETSNL